MANSNQRPDNNMLWAILSTLFCCLPLGIVSIINASKVDGLYRNGEYQAAQEASESAKKYARWSAIGAGIFWIIYLIFAVAIGVFSEL